MQSAATVPGEDDVGLSILDVTKHAVKTIAATLGPNDRLSLVSYSSNAEVVLDLTAMDEVGRGVAKSATDSLRPQGMTNLWGGLYSSLNVLKNLRPEALPVVLLLTDGRPNVEPARGHVGAYNRYCEQNPHAASVIVNTFGFGYNLDSALLNDLAIAGRGAYAFIPDSGMVGTAFTNIVPNMLSLHATAVRFSVEGCRVVRAVGGLPVVQVGDEGQVEVGGVSYGQTRDAVLEVSDVSGRPDVCVIGVKDVVDVEGGNVGIAEYQYLRCATVDTLRELLGSCATGQGVDRTKLDEARQKMEQFMVSFSTHQHARDLPSAQALYRDLRGQVTEAFSKHEWMQKWGQHFIPSLSAAHRLQICNNFKDPGVQVYGGRLFKHLRDEADDIFTSLPPPEPSNVRVDYGSNRGGHPMAARRMVDMSAYHSAHGVCFTGESRVHLAAGGTVEVRNLEPGTEVVSEGGAATVLCVLESSHVGDLVRSADHQDLTITPYHPVRTVPGQHWSFPCETDGFERVTINGPGVQVYSVALQGGVAALVVNDVLVASLGHNEQGDVIGHPFFGSITVLDWLKQHFSEEFSTGKVVLPPAARAVKDDRGLVCGWTLE